MSKRSFVFDLEWAEVLKEYRPEVRHEVYDAIIEYAASGTLTGELKPLAMMAFSFIRRQMDYNRDRYETTVEKRREAGRSSAQARARQKEAGKADPTDVELDEQNQQMSANAESVEQNQQMSANPTDIDIVIDIDNDIDKYLTLPLGVGGEQEILVRKTYMDLFFANPELGDILKRWKTTPEELRDTCEFVLDQWTIFDKRHESAQDAKAHFVYAVGEKYEKKIRQKKPRRTAPRKEAASPQPTANSDIERLDRQQKERDEAFEKQEREAVKPADYIRSLGYDPKKVTMVQVLNPDWRDKNPPTLNPESA